MLKSGISRRALFSSLFLGACSKLSFANTPARVVAGPEVDRLVSQPATEPLFSKQQRYRIHASVTFLSLTLVTRTDCGAGCLMVEQAKHEDGRVTALQFSGGSWKARAAGLNRFGMQQEALLFQAQKLKESAWCGFMTSSPEKSLDQARRALESGSGELTVSVVHGASSACGCSGDLRKVQIPGTLGWPTYPQAARVVREGINKSQPCQPRSCESGVPQTFLYTAREAMLSSEKAGMTRFFYNGEQHVLEFEKKPDADRTKDLAKRGIHRSAETLTMLLARIKPLRTGGKTEFRVWYEAGDSAGLPVRIEFRPRSFLHLIFEQDAKAEGPALVSLFG